MTKGFGRLTREWTQKYTSSQCASAPSGYQTMRSILAYDPMGRVESEQQCTPANCSLPSTGQYSLQYSYDLAGNVTFSSSGLNSIPGTSTPLTFTSAYDAAGRLQSVSSSWAPGITAIPNPGCIFSAQKETAQATPACSTVVSAPYQAFGGLANGLLGNGALTLSRTYDGRLRVTGENDTGSQLGSGTAGAAVITITGTEQSH